VPWTWWVMIGTVVTFSVGWITSVFFVDADDAGAAKSF